MLSNSEIKTEELHSINNAEEINVISTFHVSSSESVNKNSNGEKAIDPLKIDEVRCSKFFSEIKLSLC